MSHRHRNPIICVVLLVVAVLTVQSRATAKIEQNVTHVDNIELSYDTDIPESTARGLAELVKKANAQAEGKISVWLLRTADGYRLTVPLRAEPTETQIGTIETKARLFTDILELDKPLEYQLLFGEPIGKQKRVVKAQPPIGQLYQFNGDYVYYGQNMTEADAEQVAKGLTKTGLFTGNMAYVKVAKSDTEFVISMTYDRQQLESIPDFSKQMQVAVNDYRNLLFDGATTRLVGCKFNFEPHENLAWTAKGLRPDQKKTQVDNIVVLHDKNISIEIATAVAERLPLRGQVEKTVAVTLSGDKKAMECRMSFDVNKIGPMMQYVKYYGREVLSAIDGCESLKFILVEKDGTPFVTREVTQGHGAYTSLHANRLYYPKNTPQSRVDNIQSALQSMDLFSKDSEITAKLCVSKDNRYTLRMAFDRSLDLDDLSTELPGVGQVIADSAFQGEQFSLEFTDYDFKPNPAYSWQAGETAAQ